MRLTVLLVTAAALTWIAAYGQAEGSAFEVASVKPAAAGPIQCSGGPGTSTPGTWTCASVPLTFLITNAFGFQAYQFRPNDPCCMARYNVVAKLPQGPLRSSSTACSGTCWRNASI